MILVALKFFQMNWDSIFDWFLGGGAVAVLSFMGTILRKHTSKLKLLQEEIVELKKANDLCEERNRSLLTAVTHLQQNQQSFGVPYWELDMDHKLTYVSPELNSILFVPLNIDVNSAVGKKVTEIPEFGQAFREAILKLDKECSVNQQAFISGVKVSDQISDFFTISQYLCIVGTLPRFKAIYLQTK